MEHRVNILQLNICGTSSRSLVCTDNYINSAAADLVFLSETKTAQDITFTNFETISKPNCSSSSKGGVSLSARPSFAMERLTSLEADDIDAIFAIVSIGGTRVMVSSVYIPPNTPTNLDKYLAMLSVALSNMKTLKCSAFAAFGDLNCRHSEWGDHKNNAAGTKLSRFLGNSNCLVLCKFVGNSFLCTEGGSRIDLGIVCNKFYNTVSHQHTDDSIELFTGAPNRGHLPVWTTLNAIKKSNKPHQIDNWSATDWVQYQESLEKLAVDAIPHANTLEDTRDLWALACQTLLQAKSHAVPQKTVTSHSKPYWNSQLTILSQNVRNTRKKFKAKSTIQNYERLEIARELFNQALAKAKTEHLEHQAKELNYKNGTAFWQRFKRTFYSKPVNQNIPALMDNKGNFTTQDEAKADLFYQEIFCGKHLDLTNFDQSWHTHVAHKIASMVKDDQNDTDSPLNQPISIEEITMAIKKTKHAGKSADLDGIHPKMLTNAGPQFLCILFILFNSVLITQNWPWHKSKIIFLRKPGKRHYDKCASYRPISITSYVGKLCERVLENRIRLFAEANKLIPETQHGFRTNRSTATCVSNLFRAVQDGNRNKMQTAGLFIDLQKAFDSVWVEGLLYKLHTAGVHGRLFGTVRSFLTNRKVVLQINNHTTPELMCNIGVPQGSVLSPLLFTIYVSDMLKDSPGLGLQFADDTSIILREYSSNNLELACQRACNSIDQWLSKWRMQANAEKSALLLFKGNITSPTLYGKKITQVRQTKVLGIWIDESLKCNYQLQLATKNINNKWKLLKQFINNKLHASVAKKILQTVILPKATYLSYIWDPHAQLSIYQQLKDLLHAPFNPPLESLYVLAHIKPQNIANTQYRLQLVNQILLSGDNLSAYPKSSLTQLLKSESSKFLEQRNHTLGPPDVVYFSKLKIRNHIQQLWEKSWQNFCSFNTQSEGLLTHITDCKQLLNKQKLPLDIEPRLLGQLCGLITGHANLQLHKYKLGLTYSPTCICLEGDESPLHFLFECVTYSEIRQKFPPSIDSWDSIKNFLVYTHRVP